MSSYEFALFYVGWIMAGGSPGPATLSIAGTSMEHGRRAGLIFALGILVGSASLGLAAAFGMSAVMLANAWAFELIRYGGAAYLMFLAYKSAKSALRPGTAAPIGMQHKSARRAFGKGLALHLTNPKAILFFGSLYAVGVPVGAPPSVLVTVIMAVGVQSAIIFHGYAILFSSAVMVRGYQKMRRGFDALLALGFGFAGFKILTARLG